MKIKEQEINLNYEGGYGYFRDESLEMWSDNMSHVFSVDITVTSNRTYFKAETHDDPEESEWSKPEITIGEIVAINWMTGEVEEMDVKDDILTALCII